MYLILLTIEVCFLGILKVCEKLYEAKLVRAIGVCKFEINHLKELEKPQSITPMVNQIEVHTKNIRKELIPYCKNADIICVA